MVEAYWTTTYDDVDHGKVRALLGPPHAKKQSGSVHKGGQPEAYRPKVSLDFILIFFSPLYSTFCVRIRVN